MAMNLGDETLREVTSNRAEIVHNSSQRSIAASDDFHSASERAVSPASSDEATTVIHRSPENSRVPVSPLLPSRRTTPPQQQQQQQQATLDQSSDIFYQARSTPSPAPSAEGGAADNVQQASRPRHTFDEPGSGNATPRPGTMVRTASDSRPTTQHTVIHSGSTMPTQPQPAAFQYLERPTQYNSSLLATTHLDTDPPRLADSLGVSAAGQGVGAAGATAARGEGPSQSARAPNGASVVRDDPRQRQGWEWQTSKAGNPIPTPGVDPTPELHFVLDQLTRDEDVAGVGRDSYLGAPAGTVASSRYSEYIEDRNQPPRVSGASDAPFIQRESGAPVATSAAATAAAAAAWASRPDPAVRTASNRASVSNRYSPAEAAEYSNKSLRAVPVPLRLWSLLGLLLLCIFALVILVYSSVHSALSGGLTRYDGTGTSLYFAYRYLPQMIAAIIIVWLQTVQDAMQRILPFVSLASNARARRSHDMLRTMPRFKTSYILPDVTPFVFGESGIGVCNLIFWLTLFTVPLASALYTPIFIRAGINSHWQWIAVQAVCWTLLPIYFLLIVALIFVAFRFNLRPTNLAWDPASLADIFVLLRRGNTTISRYSRDSGKLAGRPDTRPVSLGLWRSPSNANGLSYGLGVDIEASRGAFSPPPAFDTINPSDPNSPYPISHFESWQTNYPDGYPWLPWFLRPSAAALWMAIALVLLIAFLVVSWVHKAVQVGFNPLLLAGVSTGGINFSSANFLYSFLPALLGMFCYLFWQPIDATYRALQPFVEMQRGGNERPEGGATAERSVLLDYNARAPISVSLAALRHGHFRVAWFSFVTLVAMVIPVLAGGVFQAQYVVGTADTINEIASIPGYVALCVFATVYALSYLLVWPSRAHRLPHAVATVADVADFVVGSRLLNDVIWRGPATKTILVTDLVAQRRLTGEKVDGAGNFRFGEHLGLDGKPRIGIYRSS